MVDTETIIPDTLSGTLQIYVLCRNINQLNPNYVRLFNNYQPKTIFSGIQFPDAHWFNHFNSFMNDHQIVELYNHYRIWYQCSQTNQPMVILDNTSNPTQSDNIIIQLIKSAPFIPNIDILFYGGCNQSQYDRSVIINSKEFPIYRMSKLDGAYAYMINPSGSRKLISQIFQNPNTLQSCIQKLISDNTLIADVYNPSIIRSENQKSECQCDSGTMEFSSIVIMLLIIIGIMILILLFFLALPKNLTLTQQPISSFDIKLGSIQSPLNT